LNSRMKRDVLLGSILGLVLLILGIWLGLIGWYETMDGPQGYGVYKVTYPFFGIILAGAGLGAFIAIIKGLLTGEPIYWTKRPKTKGPS